MLRAALLAVAVLTAACGANSQRASAPGPNMCRDEGKGCAQSSECCSDWCANWVCERKMARRDLAPGERSVE